MLSWAEPVDPPSDQTAAVASRFADQAALALAEASRREAARDAERLHERFERSLLPSIRVQAPDVGVEAIYRPGDARLRLGGDFYDCLELPGGEIALLIGDVAGHGPGAAALGASMRSAWRALALSGVALEDVTPLLQRVCEHERLQPDVFVTAISGVVDAGRRSLRFVVAGHPQPVVLGCGGEPPVYGPPLGVVDDGGWTEQAWPLGPGSSVLLYTDGLIEGRADPSSSERLGLERVLRGLDGIPPGAVTAADLQRLIDIATEAHGEGLPDDVALLAVNLRAVAPAVNLSP